MLLEPMLEDDIKLEIVFELQYAQDLGPLRIEICDGRGIGSGSLGRIVSVSQSVTRKRLESIVEWNT